ncbi:MAG: hypothetical protein WC052_05145 [Patescibacteria group bacterium]
MVVPQVTHKVKKITKTKKALLEKLEDIRHAMRGMTTTQQKALRRAQPKSNRWQFTIVKSSVKK